MNYSQTMNAIGAAVDACENRIDAIIASIRAEHVIPFCERKNMSFNARMGSWSFHSKDGRKMMSQHDRNGLPFIIFNILSLEYPLNRGQSVGSIMESYTPRAWIELENLRFHRLPSDLNGNPRFVIDHTYLLTLAELDAPWVDGKHAANYATAVKRANTIGGSRYDFKRYRGGIAFQSYSIRETADNIERVTGRRFNVV